MNATSRTTVSVPQSRPMLPPGLPALTAALMAAGLVSTAQAQLQIAGPLLVDVDASTLPVGPLSSVANAGTAGGFFEARGGAAATPRVNQVYGNGAKAIEFDGNDFLQHVATLGGPPLSAPAGVTGPNPTSSIEAWVMNPWPDREETVVAWGHRGGPDGRNKSLLFGFDSRWAAIGHWGGADIGWDPGQNDEFYAPGQPSAGVWHHLVWTYDGTTTRVYADGVLKNSESIGLDTYPLPAITIGAQLTDDASTVEPALRGSLSIARLRIHDGVLSDSQVLNNFNFEAPSIANGMGSAPAYGPIHRYSFTVPAGPVSDGTVIPDSVGTGDGVVRGANAGATGSRLTLPGGSGATEAYVDLPNGVLSSSSLNRGGSGQFSIEGWTKVTGSHNWSRVFDIGSSDIADPGLIGGEVPGPGGGGEGLDYLFLSAMEGVEPRYHHVSLRNIDPPGGDGWDVQIGNLGLNHDFHWVVTWDEQAGRLVYYEDGGQAATREFNGAANPMSNINDVNVWLGRSNWTGDGNLQGEYDEVRIYDRVLTVNEVRSNFVAGPNIVAPPQPITLVRQPQSQTVEELNNVTFTVGVQGVRPYTFQWYSNGMAVAGATTHSLTLASVLPVANGAQFECVVGNSISGTPYSATSQVAMLTVIADLQPPALVGAAGGAGWMLDRTHLGVRFTESVNEADAENLANYTFSGGITVTSATLLADNITVVFESSPLDTFTCKSVSVSNVRDRSPSENVILPGSTTPIVYADGTAAVHRFDGIGGVNVSDLLNNAAFPNSPSARLTVNQFEYPGNGGDFFNDYGARIMAFLSPPVTGNYTFYVAADDGAALWLSTDVNPANRVRIANEPVWAANRQWTGPADGGGRACPSSTACNISAPIPLQAGCRYYIELIYKEGGGGDYGAVTWQTPAGGPQPGVPANGSAPIPGQYLSAFNVPATFLTDIAPAVSTPCGTRVTFSPVIIGTAPLTFQWYRDGMPIPGANSATYTTETLGSGDDGTVYYLVATTTDPAGSAESQHAVITITPDGTAPLLLSAESSPNLDQVTLVFSKILETAVAEDTVSYSVIPDGGGALAIITATLQPDGRTVVLATSPQPQNTLHTVAVDLLTDFCGNPMAATNLVFRSYVTGGGGLQFQAYNTGGGTLVPDLTNSPIFPGSPNFSAQIPVFDTRSIYPDDSHDNYGARIRGLFIPPTSGNWVFYLASDDSSVLYLNPTGPSSAGKVVIAEEPGCCNVWTTLGRFSSPLSLVANQGYYIEALYKEGGGGDYCKVSARLESEGPPSDNPNQQIPISTFAMSGAMLGLPAAPPGIGGPLNITLHPVPQSAPEGGSVFFNAAGSNPNGLPIYYQWQRKDFGAPNFNDIPGAIQPILTLGPLVRPTDHKAQFRCILRVIGTEVVTSAAALDVVPDTVAPVVMSVGSLLGTEIGVCFSELIDPTSAQDAVNYTVNGGAVSVASATLRADGKSVVLSVSGLSAAPGTPFQVGVTGVLDVAFAPNVTASGASGQVLGLASADIGNPGDPHVPSQFFACSVEITTGGSDIWNNQDGFHFDYTERTGNFDVRVRVESLIPANVWSKAGLMARENLTPGSRNLNAIVDPAPTPALDGSGNGANFYEANYRDTQDGGPGEWPGGGRSGGVPYPNAWIRLTRAGNLFTAYRGTDGLNWTQFAQTSQSYPPSIFVGLATCSHSSTFTTTAIYQDFAFVPEPVITQQPAGGTFQCSSNVVLSVTASGAGPLTYQWRIGGVDVPGGNGSSLALNPANLAQSGAYDVVVSGAGGSVTSTVAAVTIVDTLAPSLACAMNQTVTCGTPWTFTAPTATDACDPSPMVTVISTLTNTACGSTYAATRVWQAVDASANTAYCTQVVSVVDTDVPLVSCPANITRVCLGPLGSQVTFSASAMDACAGALSPTCQPPSGSHFAVGTTMVTCSAVDPCGNSNSCSFTIEVLSNPGPVWTTVADFSATTMPSESRSLRGLALSHDESSLFLGLIEGSTTASLRKVDVGTGNIISNVVLDPGRQTLAVATDDRGYVYAGASMPSGTPDGQFQIYNGANMALVNIVTPSGPAGVGGLSVRRVGATYYLYVARQAGSAATVQRFNVTDPMVVNADISFGTFGTFDVRSLFPAAANLRGMEVADDGTIYVADGDNNAIYKISSSLASGLAGSAPQPMDVVLAGDRLYATRHAGMNSGVHVLRTADMVLNSTIAAGAPRDAFEGYAGIDITLDGRLFVADQVYSNTPATVVQDRVLASSILATNLSITCPAPVVVQCGTAIPAGATSQAEFETAGGIVPCQSVSISFSDGPLTPGPLTGTITRTYTAVDGFGNVAACTQTITIEDTAPPTLACPANIATNVTTVAGTVINYATPSASDVCDPAPTVLCAPASGGLFPIGFTTVTCTATDASANAGMCSFVVAVQLCHDTNYVVNATIPDNNINGLASTKTFISPIGIITDVNVSLTITGGFNGDLYAYLVHDSGFSVLLNRAGRTATAPLGYGDAGFAVKLDDQATDDIHSYRFTLFGDHTTPLAGPLTNSWQPDARSADPFLALDTDSRSQYLTNFNGLNPNGEWTLFVADVSGVDIATLADWGLEICGYPPVPLAITAQSGDTTAQCSSNVTLSVTTTGTLPVTNQWYVGLTPIGFGNGATLTLTNVHPTEAGTYTVVVCNMAGCVTSAPIVLNVIDTIAPTIATCATNQTLCADPMGMAVVPDMTAQVVASDACSAVTVSQTPTAGSLVGVGNTTVTLVVVDAASNTNTCSAVLAVAGPPTITSQPQSQTRPMGNSASFSVVASSIVPFTYQWQLNGVDAPGQTAASLTLNNLTLDQNGTAVQVVLSNCAGVVTSAVAVLTVAPQAGIAFDFNTPGQFTNQPYALAMNNWMNSALPPLAWETATGGVGTATGGGAIDLTAGGGDNGTTLLPLNYDFSLTGKTLYASAMIKLKAPTANTRAIQMAFVSATNVNNVWQQVNANNGQGFMSVIMQSTTQPALTYSLRAQHKLIAGTATIETTPVNTPTNVLAANTWYKLVTKFTNLKGPGTLASNYTVEASLQNMGANGMTPGAVVLAYPALLQTNVDMVNASRLYFCVRSGAETGGSDYWDNIYVHTTNGPVFFVQGPQSQNVLHGRSLKLQALVDGDGPYAYQWQLSNSGAGFLDIPNATAWNLFVPAVSVANNQSHYRVVVTGPSSSATSDPALVTVLPDALDVVSAGSVDGCAVGIQFDQAVDPVSASNPANYLVNGVPAIAAQVYQSPTDLRNIVQDGTRVVVTPAAMFTGAFTVSVSGVLDASGNPIAGVTAAAGTSAGLTGEDVNPYVTQPTGQQYSFADGQFEITGGGQDISGSADSFRFVYSQQTGDFDVKARVAHMDVVRSSTKAGFDVRTSLDPFSPSVLASVMAPNPSRNLAEGVIRQNYNTASATWGSSTAHAAGFPNVWVRLRRVGNTFLRYSSTNGSDWRLEGQVAPNPALPDTLYLGLAVCGTVGNAVGMPATVWFENYGSFAGYPGASIALVQDPVDLATNAGSAVVMSAIATLTGGPASELAYSWQRSDGMGGWVNVPLATTTTASAASTNSLNTGALFGADNGAQYRVVVSAPGALSVTSAVATVTVNDAVAPTIVAGHVPTNAVRNIILVYSEPMGASALNTANYAVTNGAGASFGVAGAAFLSGDPRVVQLTTASDLLPGSYGVLVNAVQDLAGTAIAANTVRLVYQMGYGANQPFVVELYSGLIASGAITNLLNHPKYGGGDVRHSYPELINYSNVFGINGGTAAFPNTMDNYGIRMYSWFVPPTNGAYKFYTRGDDFVQFWMNTNPATSTLPPDGVIASSNSAPPGAFNSPIAQQAFHAIDNNINTKYLNFHRGNPGLVVSPAVGATVVRGLRFTSAEDAMERDPMTFTLEGTTGDPSIGPWTVIAVGSTGLVTNRLTTVAAVTFANSSPYTSYRLLFPTLRNTGNNGVATTPNSMQIAEIEFLDAGGQDVTGRGALRQVELTAANANYSAANSVTHTLVGGQPYFVELRFKESTGGDGGTVAVRNDNTVPAATEVAPGNLFQYPAPYAPAAPVQIEIYTGQVQGNPIGNGRIEDLIAVTNTPGVVAGIPNLTGYGKYFGFSTNLANTGFDNYFGRLYAHYVAPSNGLYRFYMRADDSAELWMNTNAVNSTDPAGATRLGYLERFISNNYWLIAENVPLVGGQRYFIEGRWREGTGGDGITVAIRAQGDAISPLTRETIPASQLEMAPSGLRFGPVQIAGITPLNPTLVPGDSIVFQAVGISGTPPYGIQWLKNGVQVMANALTYTNPPITAADDGAVFTLVVTNYFSRAEASSVISVPVDNAPPTLVSAVGSQYQEFVTVTFDGPVEAMSAACLANYRINNGVQVLSVALDSGRRNRVSLRTSPQTPGTVYTVTVNDVKDPAGNVIAANSTINYTAWTWGGCGFLVELFTNITGSAVLNLTSDGKYVNNLPDISYYTNVFGAGRFAADSGLNNYGARVSAYVQPPSSGLYRFYVRGDDGTMLFMNTNGPDARARVMIARNDGANSSTYLNGVGNGIAGASISPILSLTNGTSYYIEALMKEGGGGDHLEVVFRPVNPVTLTDVPPTGTPAAADLNPEFAVYFAAPGNPDSVQLVITEAPPTTLNVRENDLVNLRLVADFVPPSARLASCFQWQKETAPGSGIFNNIPGATTPILPTFAAQLSENGLKYRLIASLPAPQVFTTTLNVTADVAGPTLVSVSSLDGTNLHLCFSEPIDRPSGTAEDTAQYVVNNGAVTILSALLRTNDDRTVILNLADPVSGQFTVEAGVAGGIQDLAVNFALSSATGIVQQIFPGDVGNPPGVGSSFSCTPGEIDVIAGGSDLWNTSDQGHLALRPICGDFDIWVRLQRLDRVLGDPDNVTKAGLMVRESWAPDARKLQVLLEPPASQGGREFFEAGQRPIIAAATAAWNGGTGNTLNLGRAGIPDGWMRIKRQGNSFQAFRSSDGLNWVLATTNEVVYSNVVYVGLAATAHVPFTGGAVGAPFGNAYVTTNGGVGDSGTLHLTDNVNNQAGSFIIPEMTPGKGVRSFTASFMLQIGSGGADPADGLCFSLASDLPNAATGATTAEDGIGSGLSIAIDNYPGGTTPAGPAVRLKYGNAFIAHQAIPRWISTTFVPVTINLDADGTVDVSIDNTNVFTDVATPYVPVVGRFGIFARTGGLNQRHWVDDLTNFVTAVDSTTASYAANFDGTGGAPTTFAEFRDLHMPLPPTILVAPAPADQTVPVLTPVGWTVVASNPPNAGAITYQWQLNGNPIPGATSASYSIPSAGTANAGLYTVVVGNDGGCVTASVTLNVDNGVPIVSGEMLMTTQNVATAITTGALLANDNDPEGQPLSVFGVSGTYPGVFKANFNDGQLPPGSDLFGNVLGAPNGTRIDDDGTGTNQCIHLVDSGNLSSFGVYKIADVAGGKLVNALHARWRSRIGGANAGGVQNNRPGADGMSFNWAADLPISPGNGPFYEDGVGTGLSVTVDTWDNGAASERGGLGIGIEIAWRNTRVAFDYISADAGLAKDFLRKDRFVDVSLTVSPEGLATFTYDGMTLSAYLPDYNGIAGGGFLFGTHTGSAYDNHWIDDVSILALTRDTSLASYGNAVTPFAADFNGTVQGAQLFGTAYIEPVTGVGGSGAIHLTDAVNSQAGAFLINDLAGGRAISSFEATFDLQIGSGSADGADGFSFNLAGDLPNAAPSGAEDGIGGGLSICFDNYSGGVAPPGPAIRVKYAGVFLGSVQIPKWNNPGYIPVAIRLDPDGTVDVTVNGTNVFLNFPTPYQPINGRFGLNARTGGLNQRHWVDNLSITGTAADYGRVALSGGLVTYTPPTNGCGMDHYYYVVSDGQLDGLSVAQVDVQVKESTPLPPVIAMCAPDQTYSLTSSCTQPAPDLRALVLASDNCCCLVYSQTPAPGTPLPIGSHAIALVATDTMGLSATCTAMVVVQDVAPPEIACPSDITAECMSGNSAVVTYPAPVTSDNCSSTVLCLPPSGSSFPSGPTMVTCIAMDPSANTASCQFTVTVVDTIPPMVTCQSNMLVLLGAGLCETTVSYAPPAYVDCDSSIVIMCSPASGSIFPAGTNVVNCTVTDGSANSASCSFTIAVIEIVAPVIACPADTSVECGDSTLPAATGVATATDNCDMDVLVTYADGTPTEVTANGQGGWNLSVVGGPPTSTAGFAAGPATPPLGTGSLRLTVGADGDSLAQARNTNYHGVRLSHLTELGFRTWVVANNGNGETIYLTLNVDTDNNGTADDLLVFEPEYQSGYTMAVPDQGVVALGVWQTWDAMRGGWYSLNQPGIMAPGAGVKPLSVYLATFPNTRIVNTGTGSGGVRLVAGSGIGGWENFDGSVDRFAIGVNGSSTLVDFDDVPGAGYDTIVRTWTAMDDSGNRTSCSQVIQVVDTTVPLVTCPLNLTLECSMTGGATANFVATATDACDPAPLVVCTPASGSVFALGTTPVQCVATDSRGNSNLCSFTVTVIDTTAPSIVCPASIVLECAGPGGAPASFAATASDVCDPSPMVSCVPASGTTFAIGANTVVCTATDMNTNTATCSFTVTVQDTTRPVLTACAMDQLVPANANCEGVVPDLTVQVVATDLCGPVSISQVPVAGSVFTGSLVATLTVTDLAGNSTNCTATLTTVDQTAPVIGCPANFTAECATPAGTVVNFTTVATDNCTASPDVHCEPGSGTVFAPGTTTVNCVAIDGAGNSNTCSFAVAVVDTTDPSFCSNPPIAQDAGGTNDNFGGVESALPSADLQDVLVGVDLRDFDDGGTDEWFAHTFEGLPDDISSAVLRIKLRALASGSENDTIELLFSTPGGGALPQDWMRRIGTNTLDNIPGLRPPWTAGSETELVLDLSALPNANNTTTDLIPTLRAQRYLDIILQDNTMVDYVVLEVTTCQCGPDIQVNADPMACGALVSFATPVFSDNCDTDVTVVCTPASGSFFGLGTTTVECRGTDDSGNVGRCSFNVTVVEPGPDLQIQVSGANVVISWPISCVNYRLEETTSLNPVITWSTVGAPVFINMGRYTVTLPIQPGNRFFRLANP